MENTRFLRKYINLLSYDKPYNSLPFISLIIFIFVGLANILMAALAEKDVDISLEALKDVSGIAILYFCIIEHSVSPKRSLSLIKLIEDEFLVGEHDFLGKVEKWTKFEQLHAKKKGDMRLKSFYMASAQFFIFFGYFIKNFLNYILGIRVYLDDESKRWPTPFLYPLSEFQSSAYLIYTYALYIFILAAVCIEGYVMLTSVCVSTERILADFETFYLLLDQFANDFPDFDSSGVPQFIPQQYGMNCKAGLREDMELIVKCHQNINRNLKICADNSAFVVSAAIAVIVSSSCSNAFFVLKTNDVKKAVSFTSMLVIESLTLFFFYQNGQRIFDQNNVLRKYLSELPWTDKPRWFRQTVHIMMIRANVDTEMRPYGIFVLNYMSFKDVMKLSFSVGNVLYSTKLANQSQQY